MCEPTDSGPETSAEQIAAALTLLRSPEDMDATALRDACAVLLALSQDPFERLVAKEVLCMVPT